MAAESEKGNYAVGLEHLPDGQVLPILLKLDPDSLLNCGRASSRLYRLVSDWEVWAHLLNKVTEFSDERLEQLVQFKREGSSRFEIVCKPEMMMAVAKEVATRCQENTENAEGGFLKLSLSLDNWDAPHTFEMTGHKYRQEFAKVAAVVGTKFTIKRLRLDVGCGLLVIPPTTVMESLRMIAAQVDQQESKSLSMLEIDTMRAGQDWDAVILLLKLIEASKEWVIQRVAVDNIPMLAPVRSKMIFAALGRCSATGHVGELVLLHFMETEQWLIKEDVRAVWDITEKVVIFGLGFENLIGGGRDKNTNVTWEEAYELLNMIC